MGLPMSIPRQFTAFTQSEIRQLFKQAIRIIREAELTILVVPASALFGKLLVVTPRAAGNSPARNRIRRRIKSIFYEQQLFKSCFTWIFIIKAGHAETSFERLKELIDKALSRIAEHHKYSAEQSDGK